MVEQRDHKQLRLRARNQHIRSDFKVERIELAPADEIGDGRAPRAAADKFTECGADFLRRRLAIGRVKIDTTTAARFGQQDFGIETWILRPMAPQILNRPRQQSTDGPRLVGRGHGCLTRDGTEKSWSRSSTLHIQFRKVGQSTIKQAYGRSE